ncbi:DUF3667 domain-containing protein [Sphingomonas sp. TZW2008]|uniref:DUF3667 domain-containing protein n=1 Tax=Sphingomonas sp. TZW2008 TaxID=1917973 RepID=UPI000A26A52A|nr:DUF3667 domain-containing protein [Sphingomonas sp. TZW2008]
MTDGIEAGADVLTGGLIARALERPGAAGGVSHDHAEDHACLNCGTTLIGSHCHACGQAAHVHRTAGAILHDIAHGVFHFEGKAWHTLPMLVTRPGELTRRYVDGERARFVSPLALFLFTVFLMFAIVANLPGWSFGDADFLKSGITGGMAEARAKVTEERVRSEGEVRELRQSLAKERGKPDPETDRLARLERRLKVAEKARSDLADAERLLPVPATFDVAGAPPASEDNWLEDKFRHAKENPKLLLYKLKTSAYKYSWALIPLSIPFLWLLFPFSRRFGVYDHAVFTTYSLTFISLLTIVLALLNAIGVASWIVIVAALIVPPFHIYRQMKGAYRLGRIGALVRTTILVGLIVSAIVPAFALLLLYFGLA